MVRLKGGTACLRGDKQTSGLQGRPVTYVKKEGGKRDWARRASDADGEETVVGGLRGAALVCWGCPNTTT